MDQCWLGWMVVWMDECVGGWKNGLLLVGGGWMVWIDECVGGWMNGSVLV